MSVAIRVPSVGTAITLAGTYRDELIRAGGGWQISARDVTGG